MKAEMDDYQQLSTDSGDVVRIGVAVAKPGSFECIFDPKFKWGEAPCKQAGIEIDILLIILSLIGLRFRFVRSISKWGCGGSNANGSAYGTVKQIIDGEVDISGNVCEINDDRSLHVGHSSPIFFSKQTFITKSPEKVPIQSIVAPFSQPVWYAIAITSLAVLALSILFEYVHKFATFSQRKCTTWLILVPIYCFFRLLRIACGSYSTTKLQISHWNLSAIFLLCVVWLCSKGFLAYLYSTEVLRAYALPDDPKIPLKNVSQLARLASSGDLRLVDYHVPPELPYSINNETRRKLERLNKSTSGIKRLTLQGSEIARLYDYLRSNPRTVAYRSSVWIDLDMNTYDKRDEILLISDQEASSRWKGFLWHKDFKFKCQFNTAINMIYEAIDNIWDYYLFQRINDNKIDKASTNFRSIELNNIRSMIDCCAFGVGLSLLAFTAECIIPVYQNYQQKHKLPNFRPSNL